MANPKNPGYTLKLTPTADPDVILVVESDDKTGDAPARTVSAVEAGRLAGAAADAAEKPVAKKAAPKPAKKPVKKAAKRG